MNKKGKVAKNSQSSQSHPHAWIVSSGDRGRKSIKKDNKVYLEDGEDFEIEIFNPLKKSVLADIKINGDSISKSGLVLMPGERFYLDCFIDTGKKFKFKTYTVEDSEQSKQAINQNGFVEVFFYKEETQNFNNWINLTPVIIKEYYPNWYPWYKPYTSPYWYLYNSGVTINSTSNSQNFYNTTTGNSFTNLNVSGSNITTNYTHTDNFIKTGRISAGEKSNLEFDDFFGNFQNYYINSIAYQILPVELKPVETSDLKPKKNLEKTKANNDFNVLQDRVMLLEYLTKLKFSFDDNVLTKEEYDSLRKVAMEKLLQEDK